jgi:hypothetical protein
VAQCGCSGAAISIWDKRSFVDPPFWIVTGVNGCEGEAVAIVFWFIGEPQFLQNTAPGGFTSPQLEQVLLTPVSDADFGGGLLDKSNPHILQNLAVELLAVLQLGHFMKTPLIDNTGCLLIKGYKLFYF